MINSSLSDRQLEIYREGNSTANRRFLSGTKRPPFELRLQNQFNPEENVTHYAANGSYYVKIVDGDIFYHSLAPNKPQKLPSPVISLTPILGTALFSFIDDNKTIMIVASSGAVIQIPNTTAFHHSGYHCVLIKNRLFLFVSTVTTVIKVFELLPAIKSLRVVLKAEWSKVLPNNSCITSFSSGNQWFLAASDFLQAYYCTFDPETFTTPKFTPMADVIDIQLNNAQMLLQYVWANETHLVWLRFDTLIIIPIVALARRQTLPGFLTIPIKNITDIMNSSYAELFTVKAALPLILTRMHVVIVTYTRPDMKRDSDYIMAISLNNGKSSMIKPLNFVNPISIIQGPTDNCFMIVTKQGSLVANYADETSHTLVQPIKIIKKSAVCSLSSNRYVSSIEIFYDLISNNKLPETIRLITSMVQNNTYSPREIILLHLLIYELEILSSSTDPNAVFIPPALSEVTCDMLAKSIYLLKMRSFSNISSSIEHRDFSSNWIDSPSAIRMDINCGNYDEALSKILASRALFLLPEISLKSPGSLSNKLTDLTNNMSLLVYLIPIAFPFLAKRIGVNVILSLLKTMIIHGEDKSVSWLLWALSLEPTAHEYDDTVRSLLSQFKMVFIDFLEIGNSLKSSGLTSTSEYILNRNNFHYDNSSTHETVISEAPQEETLTLDTIVVQLEDVLSSITKLTQVAGENASIIEKNKLVDSIDFHMSDMCCICENNIKHGNCYTFPCGHCFDEECLTQQLLDVLDNEASSTLKYYKETSDPQLENILTQDCPQCGIIATNVITKPINYKDWGFNI